MSSDSDTSPEDTKQTATNINSEAAEQNCTLIDIQEDVEDTYLKHTFLRRCGTEKGA